MYKITVSRNGKSKSFGFRSYTELAIHCKYIWDNIGTDIRQIDFMSLLLKAVLDAYFEPFAVIETTIGDIKITIDKVAMSTESEG